MAIFRGSVRLTVNTFLLQWQLSRMLVETEFFSWLRRMTFTSCRYLKKFCSSSILILSYSINSRKARCLRASHLPTACQCIIWFWIKCLVWFRTVKNKRGAAHVQLKSSVLGHLCHHDYNHIGKLLFCVFVSFFFFFFSKLNLACFQWMGDEEKYCFV